MFLLSENSSINKYDYQSGFLKAKCFPFYLPEIKSHLLKFSLDVAFLMSLFNTRECFQRNFRCITYPLTE